MNAFKLLVVVLLLLMPFQTLGSDCAVAYAHMQQGNYQLAYSEFRPLAERGLS